MELNHGPRGYESLALPLSYAALSGSRGRILAAGGARAQHPGRARRRGIYPVETTCNQCDRTDVDSYLRMCSVCKKHFCEEHSVMKSGKQFCSAGCAEYFFFAEPDDIDPEDA